MRLALCWLSTLTWENRLRGKKKIMLKNRFIMMKFMQIFFFHLIQKCVYLILQRNMQTVHKFLIFFSVVSGENIYTELEHKFSFCKPQSSVSRNVSMINCRVLLMKLKKNYFWKLFHVYGTIFFDDEKRMRWNLDDEKITNWNFH